VKDGMSSVSDVNTHAQTHRHTDRQTDTAVDNTHSSDVSSDELAVSRPVECCVFESRVQQRHCTTHIYFTAATRHALLYTISYCACVVDVAPDA